MRVGDTGGGRRGPRTGLRHWSGKALRGARQVLDYVPVTLLGLLTLPLLLGLLFAYGLGRQDHVLLGVSVCGLALVGLALLAVGLTSLCLWASAGRREQPPLELEAGVPVRTGSRVRLAGWLPLVKVEWTWEEPAGAAVRVVPEGASLAEEVTAEQRGVHAAVVRRFTVSDVFGLARWSFRRRSRQPVKIAPSRGQVEVLSILPQHESGDALAHPEGKPEGDRLELRNYAPGDPLKHVLWKTYARTGRLLVRAPERAVKPCERTLAYLVAAPGDEPSAGVARALLESGGLGRDLLFAAGDEDPTREPREAREQVIRSARDRSGVAAGLETLLAQGEAQGVQACVLFVPPEPGEWLDRVAAQVARHRGPFRALVAVDGVAGPARGFSLWDLLLWATREPGTRPEDLRTVCERLAAAGAEVTVVNRKTGEIVGEARAPEREPALAVAGEQVRA
jgi:hypothetical protein